MSGRLPLWRAWLAAIAAGTLLLAGCGGSDDSDGAASEEGAEEQEAVELHFEWWGNDQRAELTEQAIDLFMEANPNITVTTAFATFTDYWPAMNTKIAGGDAPDVLQMDYTYLREYAERGVLMDLNEQVGSNLDVDGVLPALMQGGTLDGSLYGVPMGRNLMSFQYDPVIWEEAGLEPPEAGWTWQDYLDAAIAITESNGGDPVGTSGFGQHVTMFEVWLIQQGKELYTEDGQLGFTRDDLVAWWEQEQAFFDAGAAANPFPDDPAATRLGSHQSASELLWDNFLAGTETTYGSELHVAPWPSDTGDMGAYFKPSMMLSVAERTEHPEEAAMLVDFLTNDPEVGTLWGVDRGIPSAASQLEAIEVTGVEQRIQEFQVAVEDLVSDTPPPPPQGAAEIERAMLVVAEELRLGQVSIEEAADRMFSEAELALG